MIREVNHSGHAEFTQHTFSTAFRRIIVSADAISDNRSGLRGSVMTHRGTGDGISGILIYVIITVARKAKHQT